MRCFSLCLLIIALCNSMSFAQESASAVDQAKKLVSENKCNEAIPLLRNVYQKKFRFSEGEKASVLLTECYLRQQNRSEAEKISSKYLEYYVKTRNQKVRKSFFTCFFLKMTSITRNLREFLAKTTCFFSKILVKTRN